jgi:cell wall-associated NlpC family hydrolase
VSLRALAPGDVLFYAADTTDPASIYHVGMYVGAGKLIQAPRTGDVVQIAPVRLNDLIGAVRPVTSQSSQRTS